jgi:hypothetical protein
MSKPVYKMSDAELDAIACDDEHPLYEEAVREMDRRADEVQLHEDTPCLPEPWWVTER